MKKQPKPDYWFKRRRYGYGWTPVTWQGGVVILVFVAVILLGSLTLKDTPENTFSTELGIYLLTVLIATGVLVQITLKKGPKPKWRWGVSKDDNPDEDI